MRASPLPASAATALHAQPLPALPLPPPSLWQWPLIEEDEPLRLHEFPSLAVVSLGRFVGGSACMSPGNDKGLRRCMELGMSLFLS